MKRVMISGGFDPIHRGHIDHIQRAKKLGDWLIVSVNPDEDMIRKKGYCLMPLADRIAIISELKSVDEVVVSISDEGRQGKTLREIKPDIYAKGGDRTPDNMIQEEIDVCKEIGCEIIYSVGDKLESSSSLVEKVIKQIGGKI